jgi:FkbM family methyltransferase
MPVQIAECRHGRFIYLDNDRFIGKLLETYGEYSEGEVELFAKLLNPGDVVVEVGANIGSLTVPLAKIVQPGGWVLAFEPQPFIYNMLCGNIALNHLHNIKAWPVGLGAAESYVALPVLDYEKENNFGAISLKGVIIDPKIQHEPVSIRTLDGMAVPKLALLKIDVEGMEIEVLRGAVDTIQSCRPYMYIEDDRPENSTELHAFIKQLGYKIEQHQPPLFNLDNNYKNCHETIFPGYNFASFNLLCTPE